MSRSQNLSASSASDTLDGFGVETGARARTVELLSGRPGGVALVLALLAYLVAASFGRWMIVLPDIPITVWPPNGVILAMLLTQPRNSWPWWIAVGAFGELLGNALWFHNPLFWALGYVAANAAAVTMAAFVMSSYLDAPLRRLATLRQVLALLAIGVVAAPAISATLGSAVDALAGKNPFTTTWPLWWLGDATGTLIATPLVISAINVWRERATPTGAQLFEGIIIAIVLAGLSAWEMRTGNRFSFLMHLPVLWAALRFEFRGATLAVLGLAIAIGIHAQTLGAAQADGGVTFPHVRLQALIAVAAMTGLIVAAIIRQQRQATSELARNNRDLEARVAERSRVIEAAEQRFKATFQNAGVGISIVSGDGILMRVNDSLAEMLGYEVDDMEGHPLDQFTHPGDRALGEAAWKRLESGAADEYELEKRYLGKDGAQVWGHTTVSCVRRPDGRIAYLIKIIQDITARKRSDDARQLLMREVNHRSKNLLSIVQAVARQTAARSPDDFIATFSARLRALAANQDLLVKSGWQRVDLDDLVRSQLEHFGTIGERFELSGPTVKVSPAAAQALVMALHELATNATKYGSLGAENGKAKVKWKLDGDSFQMAWEEVGGPEITAPQQIGFGTTVLKAMTEASLSGEVSIEYLPSGLCWQVRCPAASLDEFPAAEDCT